MPEHALTLASVHKQAAKGERPTLSLALRNFGGVNLTDARDAMGDEEFFWLEDLIPRANGRLQPAPQLGPHITTPAGESGPPTLFVPFNISGANWGFAVWANSGNAWVGTMTASATWTKIATGTFTSGLTAAAQWNDLGLLIVDSTAGYFDYNITTAATLTYLSGQIDNPVVTPPPGLAVNNVTGLNLTVHDSGPGTGALVGASTSCTGATIAVTSTGYLVGDLLFMSGGVLTTNAHAPLLQQNQPLTLLVTSVDGSGHVLTMTIQSPGYYQSVPANPVAFTGGSGGGFTANMTWQIGNPFIIAPGHGYVNPTITNGGATTYTWFTVGTSGTLLGSAIAVYAGRVWIAVQRTVQFTDIDSYQSFGGVGGAFTINDEWLHSSIIALVTANNYLYIAGDDSWDILSNVQVVNDVTTFSRINATASVGTDQPASVFADSRSIKFANTSGFWELSGATPIRLTEKIEQIIEQATGAHPVSAGVVDVNGVRAYVFLFSFTDTFTGVGARTMLLVNLKNRWWFTAQGGSLTGPIASQPIGSTQALYAWFGSALWRVLSGSPAASWRLSTKLWDLGAPMTDKFVLNAAVAGVMNGDASSDLSMFIDTPTGTFNAPAVTSQLPGASGYTKYVGSAPPGGTDSIGLTLLGSVTANTSSIRLLAIEVQPNTEWTARAS